MAEPDDRNIVALQFGNLAVQLDQAAKTADDLQRRAGFSDRVDLLRDLQNLLLMVSDVTDAMAYAVADEEADNDDRAWQALHTKIVQLLAASVEQNALSTLSVLAEQIERVLVNAAADGSGDDISDGELAMHIAAPSPHLPPPPKPPPPPSYPPATSAAPWPLPSTVTGTIERATGTTPLRLPSDVGEDQPDLAKHDVRLLEAVSGDWSRLQCLRCSYELRGNVTWTVAAGTTLDVACACRELEIHRADDGSMKIIAERATLPPPDDWRRPF